MRDNQAMDFPHQKNLRRGRSSQAGQIYHIIITTLDRQPIFNELAAARTLVTQLRQAETDEFAQTLAFVIMPDHLHWLMQLDKQQNLSSVVRGIKAKTSHQVGRAIWQSGFYDHALRKEEDIQQIARYIIANPLRAGIVSNIGDYPHWHAIWL